jgi:uncharacterized membrane protein YidH (DUF202 family)
MNTPNPFAPPQTDFNAAAASPPETPNGVPPSVIVILKQTRPWLRLTLGLLVTGMALVAIALLGVGLRAVLGSDARRSGMSAMAMVPLLLLVLIYVPPAIYLSRCTDGIRRLQVDGGVPALEDTLRAQKSFWKYTGILALVLIACYAIALAALKLGSL